MTAPSVQASHLDVESLRDGVVALAGGEYRAVLEATGSSSALDEEARRDAVLAGFAGFLNALTFPIQVLVRAVPVELGPYLAAIEERARRDLPGDLPLLAREHAAFVLGLARRRTLLERRFYVVVPSQPARAGGGWRLPWTASRAARDQADAEAARRQLAFRCDEVARQLGRCGVLTRRLDDVELAHLFLAALSPERARSQRFRQRLDDYTSLAVRGGGAEAS